MTFVKRALTVLVGLPAVSFVAYKGGTPLVVACGLIAVVGLWEFYRAFGLPQSVQAVGFGFAILHFVAVGLFGVVIWETIVLCFASLAALSVLRYGSLSLQDAVMSLFGFLYVPFLLSFVVLVRNTYGGAFYVTVLFVACFGCDTFAYLTGSIIGKCRLKNTPSPSKTVEGTAGGILGAVLFAFLVPFSLMRLEIGVFAGLNFEGLAFLTVITAAGASLSVFGDMFGSLIKRSTGIKDFGSIFPGHGGIMDRLDSVVLVAPFVYIVAQVVHTDVF